MKIQSFKLIAMALLLSVSAIIVQAGNNGNATLNGAKFNVPFDFQIGSKSYPAGEYKFQEIRQRNGFTLLQIYGEKQGIIRDALPPIFIKDKLVYETKLTFNRYGDKHFLTEITATNSKIKLKKSKLEKKVKEMHKGTFGKVFVNKLK